MVNYKDSKKVWIIPTPMSLKHASDRLSNLGDTWTVNEKLAASAADLASLNGSAIAHTNGHLESNPDY